LNGSQKQILDLKCLLNLLEQVLILGFIILRKSFSKNEKTQKGKKGMAFTLSRAFTGNKKGNLLG